VQSPDEGANFVSFRGPKGELPKGEDGSYGTSVTYYKAMDIPSDVIIAYKQNGRWLTPDHGFPVRMIIPGFIGGRMVKHLEEITVTEQESNNFYHFYDNRVMPSHVNEDLAKAEGNLKSSECGTRYDDLTMKLSLESLDMSHIC
jgi:nitrate reductase (NAD(P)H)